MLTIIACVGGFVALLLLYAYFKVKQASRDIDRLFKENKQLAAQNTQLQAKKAVAQTQVKHFETRKKYEENNRTIDRTSLIDQLQQSNDLRD